MAKKSSDITHLTRHNPFHLLEPGTHAPQEVHAFIECPMRSKIKYELDKATGILHISRMLHSSDDTFTHGKGIMDQHS